VKGELTILIQGQANSKVEPPSDIELESELRELIASGESLSTVVTSLHLRVFIFSLNRSFIYSYMLFISRGNENGCGFGCWSCVVGCKSDHQFSLALELKEMGNE